MKRLALAFAAATAVSCSKPPETAAPDPVAAVRVAVAGVSSIEETVTAYGAAEFDPAGAQALTAPFEAQVTAIHVAVGQAVARGQPVATLAPSPATRLDLERLSAEAAQARREYERLGRLRADGLASDAEVEAARTVATTAGQANRSLVDRRAAGVLRSDAPAVVDSLPVSVGAIVPAGAPVAGLGRTSRLNARLGVEVEDAQRIRVGAPVRLEAMHESGAALQARVASIDRRVDPANRLAAVLVDLPEGGPFLPGEALRGEVSIGEPRAALTAPRSAILYAGDRPYLFVVSAGKAVRRNIVLGLDRGDVVQVLQGLAAGDRVVVEGGPALADGMRVKLAGSATGSTR
jgi:RND family efflux transporter MFP subunit